MYASSPEEQPSPPDAENSPASTQRTKPGSYGKACDTCRKKKARCNFGKPACGYCSAFKHQCSYTAAAACATRRNAKKLHIETKRQRPSPATRKSTGGSFKQPYSADPRSPSGYLSPITPNERGARSAGGAYHHTRSSDLLGSPIPTSRSVYSPDSTSPTVPASPMNGHGGARYQSQEVRPYGQSATAYLPDNRGLLSKINTSVREDTYVAVPLMGEQGGKEQNHPNMMDHPASPHSYPQQGMHSQDQIQRVVSPTNQSPLAHYQSQYYEQYHRGDADVGHHDPRQQMPQEWAVRRQPMQLPTSDQRAMYRYQEVEGSPSGNYMR